MHIVLLFLTNILMNYLLIMNLSDNNFKRHSFLYNFITLDKNHVRLYQYLLPPINIAGRSGKCR